MIGGGGGNPYFLQNHQQQLFQQHALDGMDGGGFMEPPPPASDSGDAHCHALLYNLSVLREKVQQLQPLVGLAVEHGAAMSSAGAVIQEIITAASSMMYAFQHLCSSSQGGAQSSSSTAAAAAAANNSNIAAKNQQAVMDQQHVSLMQQQQWQAGAGGHGYDGNRVVHNTKAAAAVAEEEAAGGHGGTIIELDAAELLAKYTHYCQVCGKGFKRDANLRMHMRAHGDEYKSSAALANPAKKPKGDGDGGAASTSGGAAAGNTISSIRNYYSCPQEGCRWNRKHAKFQPLKSVICAKNHYKRSHCPKMYVCNRCNRKHFSVLSDLRTHEKHCGDHRWLCSCGTSFSRKDKLIGHLALFAGHQPAVPLDRSNGKRSSSSLSSSATHHHLGT